MNQHEHNYNEHNEHIAYHCFHQGFGWLWYVLIHRFTKMHDDARTMHHSVTGLTAEGGTCRESPGRILCMSRSLP